MNSSRRLEWFRCRHFTVCWRFPELSMNHFRGYWTLSGTAKNNEIEKTLYLAHICSYVIFNFFQLIMWWNIESRWYVSGISWHSKEWTGLNLQSRIRQVRFRELSAEIKSLSSLGGGIWSRNYVSKFIQIGKNYHVVYFKDKYHYFQKWVDLSENCWSWDDLNSCNA